MERVTVYPKFTKEMKRTHTILVPSMAPIHFALLAEAICDEGYQLKVLQSTTSQAAHWGLKYVHNDTCYPAVLVIGQLIEALSSGEYDVNRTALLLPQTGGGCRASNYIHLLRKALVKAGFGQVPVASFNFSGLERDSGFQITLTLVKKMIAALLYGDELMCLSNQIRPYETTPGTVDALVQQWIAQLAKLFDRGRGVSKADLSENFHAIAADFAGVPISYVPKVKVGIVGEIFVKYSPMANNSLEQLLHDEGCEVNLPGLMGFVQYCIENMTQTVHLYGGSRLTAMGTSALLHHLAVREELMRSAIAKYPSLRVPASFAQTKQMAKGMIGYGNKMGEGWLLTAEMVELQHSGFENIICAQPFGCLPNHICGKGMMNRIRTAFPNANITSIDYDPGATKVNQENRIKLMLSVGRERLCEQVQQPRVQSCEQDEAVVKGLPVPATALT